VPGGHDVIADQFSRPDTEEGELRSGKPQDLILVEGESP